MKNGSTLANTIAVITTSLQISMEGIENVFSIICLVLTIISVLTSFILKILSWYKQAKKDEIIDSEEIDELNKIVHEGLDDIQSTIKEEKKDERGDVWLCRREGVVRNRLSGKKDRRGDARFRRADGRRVRKAFRFGRGARRHRENDV